MCKIVCIDRQIQQRGPQNDSQERLVSLLTYELRVFITSDAFKSIFGFALLLVLLRSLSSSGGNYTTLVSCTSLLDVNAQQINLELRRTLLPVVTPGFKFEVGGLCTPGFHKGK